MTAPDACLYHQTGLPDFDRVAWSRLSPTTMLHRMEGGYSLMRQHPPAVADEWRTALTPRGTRHHVLVFVERARPGTLEIAMAGRRQTVVTPPGSLFLLPAPLDRAFMSKGRQESNLFLHLDPAWLQRLAEEEGRAGTRIEPQPLAGHRDRVLETLFAIARRDGDVAGGSPLFFDHWATLVALRLLRITGLRSGQRLAMAPARLARVKAHIEERLADDLTLAELAEVAGLSRFHFARAFRAETGQTPHAWLTARRCDRAKFLMASTSLPLSAIATACGFAHQAHFTTVFRRLVGTTPARWRAEAG